MQGSELIIGGEDRGVVVTASSTWTFDGNGHYRRTPRRTPHLTCGGVVSAGTSLEYGAWHEFVCASFVHGDGMRVRILPAGRPDGSFGILTGDVLWTNLLKDPSHPLAGPAGPWFVPSPVPADSDLWPGELPFTAFGQFGPDALDLRVFDQDMFWVDRTGTPHLLTEMGEEYLTNVLGMLRSRAAEFHGTTVMRESVQRIGDTLLGRVNAGQLVAELGVGSVAATDADTWLESTPLVRRLGRLLEQPLSGRLPE